MNEEVDGRGLVDVVIPTYDGREVLLECLSRLDDPAIASVVVVDDVSSDGTSEAVRERFPAAMVVELPEHRGLAHALNAGAASGDAPYVLFMNNDLIAQPGAIATLVSSLRSDPLAVSAGARLVDQRTLTTQDSYRPRDFPTLATMAVRLLGVERLWRSNPWSGGHLRHRLPEDAVSRVDQQPAGACLLVRRDAMARVGGWDEGYWFWYEDVDFSARLRPLGSALWVGTATMAHEGTHSTSAWPKHEQHRRLYLGTLRYAQQHLAAWQATLVAAMMLATCLPRLIGASLMRRDSAGVYRSLVRESLAALLGRRVAARIPPEQARRRARPPVQDPALRSRTQGPRA